MRLTTKLLSVLLTLYCCALIFSGCQRSEKIHVVRKSAKKITPPPEMTTPFLAGAAKVDITPPPGYPMAGFSLAGRFSRGLWTRLYAKAIYLEDKNGKRLALVSCDLMSMPAGLADKVAEILSLQIDPTNSDSSVIGREQIILAGTHTHHGPGNFFSSPAYNALTTPQSGFDKNLFNFISLRIARAIKLAMESKQPAFIKKGAAKIYGLSYNRSLVAFEKNRLDEKQALLNQISDMGVFVNLQPSPFIESLTAYQAVDPQLTVLKVEAQDVQKSPIAVLAFFAIHPNAMGPGTEVYSSDIFGVASTIVENALTLKSAQVKPVVAIFNGAEGDIGPNTVRQDRHNTLKLGQKLARGILHAAAEANKTIAEGITYRYKVAKIKKQKVSDLHGDADFLKNRNVKMRTAKKPFTGLSTFGGAEGSRSFLYHLKLREGLTSGDWDSEQGNKVLEVNPLIRNFLPVNRNLALGDLISNILKGSVLVPEEVPLGVYSIGSEVLATLPGEFSAALGRRIRKTLKDSLRDVIDVPEENILLVGLANEYLSYFTTPAEYTAQCYEGSSMMYGPVAGIFVEQALGQIANLPANTAEYEPKKSYDAGPPVVKDFGEIKPGEIWQAGEALENLLQDSSGNYQRNSPRFAWVDKALFLADESVKRDTAASLQVNPIVSIEHKTMDGWKPLEDSTAAENVQTDNLSMNFVTFIESVKADSTRWQSIWLVSSDAYQSETLRFCVKTPHNKIVYSEAFRTNEVLNRNISPIIKVHSEQLAEE